MENAEMQKRIT